MEKGWKEKGFELVVKEDRYNGKKRKGKESGRKRGCDACCKETRLMVPLLYTLSIFN